MSFETALEPVWFGRIWTAMRCNSLCRMHAVTLVLQLMSWSDIMIRTRQRNFSLLFGTCGSGAMLPALLRVDEIPKDKGGFFLGRFGDILHALGSNNPFALSTSTRQNNLLIR